jgi:hypothetical protein
LTATFLYSILTSTQNSTNPTRNKTDNVVVVLQRRTRQHQVQALPLQRQTQHWRLRQRNLQVQERQRASPVERLCLLPWHFVWYCRFRLSLSCFPVVFLLIVLASLGALALVKL